MKGTSKTFVVVAVTVAVVTMPWCNAYMGERRLEEFRNSNKFE